MKKTIVMLLIAAMAGSVLTGCGGASEAATAQTEAASREDETRSGEEAEPPEESGAGETAESGAKDTGAEQEASDEVSEDDDENYDTGDAAKDDPRNSDDIGEKELLVVSFGTSYNDSRRETIGAIEQALEDAYPDWSVRRAFTSQMIIDHVYKRDGVKIDNVEEALERAEANGVKQLVVQPTHIMDGFEYNDLMELIASYSDAFESVAVGDPLLSGDDDFDKVAEALHDATASLDDGKTAVCFMGHGTEADSNAVYERMQKVFEEKGYKNYYIGTVEASPGIDDIVKALEGKGYERAVLRPLMVVAGDHANNDMAGDEDDSWKSILEKAGYEVTPVLEGLGQLPDIRNIYISHAAKAMEGK
ncbi:MAG: sirohydrochlorin cobaltochelatase [Lachnospiraceae bacterium]|nr:sirohydrochlorin cobaltochelatase [Lachnospiraceae bacterium]